MATWLVTVSQSSRAPMLLVGLRGGSVCSAAWGTPGEVVSTGGGKAPPPTPPTPHPVSDFFPSESISGAGVCRMSLCLGLPDIFLRLRGGLEEEQPRS